MQLPKRASYADTDYKDVLRLDLFLQDKIELCSQKKMVK
jgi:hypothetical protein